MRKKTYIFLSTFLLIASFVLTISISVPGASRNQKKERANVHNKNTVDSVRLEKSNKTVPLMISYNPPMRGKPVNRVGGGTRGTEESLPLLAALVPDHTGLTIQSQPALYWYLSKPTTKKIEFSLIDDHSIKPILEINLSDPTLQGIQYLSLSDYDINLFPDMEYQWFVSIIFDPDYRSKDIVASGTIKHIEPSKMLIDRVKKASSMEVPGIYAEKGLWYDALSSLSSLIATVPNNQNLIKQRASLLDQAGLKEIVVCERGD